MDFSYLDSRKAEQRGSQSKANTEEERSRQALIPGTYNSHFSGEWCVSHPQHVAACVVVYKLKNSKVVC